MKVKIIVFLMLVVLLVTAISCGKSEPQLSSDGSKVYVNVIDNISDYKIIRSEDATARVKKASSDLQNAIIKTTGAMVTISTDADKETKYEIIVGNTSRKISGVDVYSLGASEFLVKKVENKIIIIGGSDSAVEKGVDFFTKKLITEENGVCVPTGNGFGTKDENSYSSIAVGKTVLGKYAISEKLYDSEIKGLFAKKLEEATYYTLPEIDSANLSEYEGNYILIEDTNTNFSEYEIKVENGNIILSANYYTIDACIDSFFSDFLGYDFAEGKITGAKEIMITDGRKYSVEKSEIYSKDKLMSVLGDVYNDNDKLIIGQEIADYTDVATGFKVEEARFYEACEVDSALFGFDVGTMIANPENTESARVKGAYDMIEYMREGGIITISAHIPNPTLKSIPKTDAHRGELGHEDKWEELMTEGTELNTKFKGYLEQMGDFLHIFKENNAPVIFRPLHEMNGNWFWFCIVNSNEDGVEKTIPREYASRLWIYMYNYFVGERGIDNMIWEYAPNVVQRGGKATCADVMYCYPGDEYCDIIAVDWYPNLYNNPVDLIHAYEDMTGATNKIFSMSEFGPGANIRSIGNAETYTTEHMDAFITECLDKGVKMAYWLTWSSWGEGDKEVKMSMYNMGGGDSFFAENDRYLDKSETANLLYD